MPLIPAVALMFLCLVLGLTVVTVILSVDCQRGLGTMKALGARPTDIRGLLARQYLIEFVMAGVIGPALASWESMRWLGYLPCCGETKAANRV